MNFNQMKLNGTKYCVILRTMSVQVDLSQLNEYSVLFSFHAALHVFNIMVMDGA